MNGCHPRCLGSNLSPHHNSQTITCDGITRRRQEGAKMDDSIIRLGYVRGVGVAASLLSLTLLLVPSCSCCTRSPSAGSALLAQQSDGLRCVADIDEGDGASCLSTTGRDASFPLGCTFESRAFVGWRGAREGWRITERGMLTLRGGAGGGSDGARKRRHVNVAAITAPAASPAGRPPPTMLMLLWGRLRFRTLVSYFTHFLNLNDSQKRTKSQERTLKSHDTQPKVKSDHA